MPHLQSKANTAAANWRFFRILWPFMVFSQMSTAFANFRAGYPILAWVSVALAVIVLAIAVWSFARYRQTRGTHHLPLTTLNS